jgi:hypothetical protein
MQPSTMIFPLFSVIINSQILPKATVWTKNATFCGFARRIFPWKSDHGTTSKSLKDGRLVYNKSKRVSTAPNSQSYNGL